MVVVTRRVQGNTKTWLNHVPLGYNDGLDEMSAVLVTYIIHMTAVSPERLPCVGSVIQDRRTAVHKHWQ